MPNRPITRVRLFVGVVARHLQYPLNLVKQYDDLSLPFGVSVVGTHICRGRQRRMSLKIQLQASEMSDFQQDEEPPSIEQILADPAASDWLKAALHTALSRDPVDAANDAEVLARVLDHWCRQMLEHS